MDLFKIASREAYKFEFRNLELNTYDLYKLSLDDLYYLEIEYKKNLQKLRDEKVGPLILEDESNKLKIIKLVEEDLMVE